MERKSSFNMNPEKYHKYRPSYPEQLYDDLILLSGIKEDGKIVEVGCGTGIATLPMAKRGYDLTAIEIGENLVDFAGKLLKNYENVQFVNQSFENWNAAYKKYDLLISASAFHWIDQKIKYVKTAQILKDTGSIGLFWDLHDKVDTNLSDEIDEIYKKIAPQLHDEEHEESLEEKIEEYKSEIENCGLFDEVIIKKYVMKIKYNSDEYVNLLDTYSHHFVLEDTVKNVLYNEIKNLIKKNDGSIIRTYYPTLFLGCVNNFVYSLFLAIS
jgi:ubiquinone/menaquinone biosynthesis C-methylase UbiE